MSSKGAKYKKQRDKAVQKVNDTQITVNQKEQQIIELESEISRLRIKIDNRDIRVKQLQNTNRILIRMIEDLFYMR